MKFHSRFLKIPRKDFCYTKFIDALKWEIYRLIWNSSRARGLSKFLLLLTFDSATEKAAAWFRAENIKQLLLMATLPARKTNRNINKLKYLKTN